MIKVPAYMYVLECSDGTLYTGYTTDVKRRLNTHHAVRMKTFSSS
ncbi:hypothetical protein F5284_07280, partial [Streptococcus agalactiae]